MQKKWYEKSLRRNLLDFHIDDWHPDFLSKFDPAHFADSVVKLGSTAATVFANTHTGLCNYPTRVGEQHAGHKGRDVLKDMIRELHDRGIDVVIYYVMIYADWYWDKHPEARCVDANGEAKKVLINSAGKPRRFSTSCPNNQEYRHFVVDQICEICSGYDFEGVWPDMTFWPTVCYCASCRERYNREIGGEIPKTINWADPRWVKFQRKRQEWMVDFGQMVTDAFRKGKPGVSVAHQSGGFHGDWNMGASDALADVTDWLSADVYGERYGLSFFGKLSYALSAVKPFEHINTWCWPNIHEHVVMRTEDHIRLTALSAMMNHGSMVFIDAIDPVGTIHDHSYDLCGRIFKDLARYENQVCGVFHQDVGIFYSQDCTIDMRENGMDVAKASYTFDGGWRSVSNPTAHRNAAVNLAKTLIQYHIPYGVVTRRDLHRLSDWQVIVLPNASHLTAEEMDALKSYVKNGGSLFASKYSSLFSNEGVRQNDLILSDLFGVSYAGETKEIVTYMSPTDKGEDLFHGFSVQMPSTLYDTQVLVKAHGDTEILATLTLPWTDPTETRYSSILTDAPGVPTNYPSVVLHPYGSGMVIYTTGVIESWEHDSQRAILARLLGCIASRPWLVQTNAPKSVETTIFLQEDKKRFVVNVINYQQELPNIPIHDLTLGIRMDGRIPKAVHLLPEGDALPFTHVEDRTVITLSVLKDFSMIEISWK